MMVNPRIEYKIINEIKILDIIQDEHELSKWALLYLRLNGSNDLDLQFYLTDYHFRLFTYSTLTQFK